MYINYIDLLLNFNTSGITTPTSPEKIILIIKLYTNRSNVIIKDYTQNNDISYIWRHPKKKNLIKNMF